MANSASVNSKWDKTGAQKWLDTLFLLYDVDPPDLHKLYDDYNVNFCICHALDCKKGGLVMAHHNDLRDGVSDLSRQSFIPMHVSDDPLILAGCSVERPNRQPDRSTLPPSKTKSEAMEQNGNLLICDL